MSKCSRIHRTGWSESFTQRMHGRVWCLCLPPGHCTSLLTTAALIGTLGILEHLDTYPLSTQLFSHGGQPPVASLHEQFIPMCGGAREVEARVREMEGVQGRVRELSPCMDQKWKWKIAPA